MTDLSQTIAPKSDQLNADDLIGRCMTIKVTKVSGVAGDQPIAIHFEGDNGKPYKPCKSMRRVLVYAWGANGADYVGRSMTLYRDERVKFGGIEVGGIRISHMSHINSPVTIALTASKAIRKPFTVQPMPSSIQTKSISPEVKEAGDNAAAGGVESYTEWLASLAPEIKETVKPYHGAWSKIAKAHDTTPPPEQTAVPEVQSDTVSVIREAIGNCKDLNAIYDLWTVDYEEELKDIAKNRPQIYAELLELYKETSRKFEEK